MLKVMESHTGNLQVRSTQLNIESMFQVPTVWVKDQLLTLLHAFNNLFFQDNVGKPAPERQTILDFTGARDDWVAVASAGPYENHLHLAPDR